MPVKIVRKADRVAEAATAAKVAPEASTAGPKASNAGKTTTVKPATNAAPAVPTAAPSASIDIPALLAGVERPKLNKVIKFGTSRIFPDIDVHEELNTVKFLAHLRKPGIWYRVVGFDEQANLLKLATPDNLLFDSKIERTVAKHYMVIAEDVGGEFAKSPNPAALKFVQELLTKAGGEDADVVADKQLISAGQIDKPKAKKKKAKPEVKKAKPKAKPKKAEKKPTKKKKK